jgi:predicted alpha/beta-fold hydrolase
LSDRGGHLGFVGRAGVDADRRWMDWRVVDWVLAQDGSVVRSQRRPDMASPTSS